MDQPLIWALLFVGTFLLGSIPWGVIVSRIGFHKDIRDEGSGNIGATNALRTMGKAGGAAVFLLDLGKGLLAGLLVTLFTEGSVALALGFLGCVWGHIFSPWLKFRGGKGISVAVGYLFFLYGPLWALAEIALFALIVALSRYVSAGSVTAAVACPLIALHLFWGQWVTVGIITLAALTVIWAHRSNLRRLRQGTESKLGSKTKERS